MQNNLGLKVELLDPTIVAEGIEQAEARFEALFFADLSYQKLDTPTASILEATKDETLALNSGVQMPLRTGGTLTFDLGLQRARTKDDFTILDPAYRTGAAFSIAQPLLRDAGVRTNTHAIRIAGYQKQIADTHAKLEVIRVVAEVDRLFWLLYAARGQLEVRKTEYDLAVQQLERVERRVTAGASPEVELVRSEAGVAARLEGIIIAENDVRQRELTLKMTLNAPALAMTGPTTLVPATDPNPIQYQLDHHRLIAAAVQNRMEMLELEIRLAQDYSTIDFRRNQTLPWLALDYRYNVNGLGPSSGDAFDELGRNDFADHRLGMQLHLPLGNQDARSRLRQAILGKAHNLATVRQRETRIAREVLGAVYQLESTWQRIRAASQRPILALRELEAEKRQFELGRRTSTDVLDAQQRLADAQNAEIRALAGYQIAQVDLAYATGTVLGAAQVDWQPIDLPAAQ